MSDADRTTYAPFILMPGDKHSLLLTDYEMGQKTHVFAARKEEGWLGNGYDWTSIAQVIVAEQLSSHAEQINFDPEAGMFTAYGAEEAIKALGAELHSAFHDEEKLQDLLSRAELD